MRHFADTVPQDDRIPDLTHLMRIRRFGQSRVRAVGVPMLRCNPDGIEIERGEVSARSSRLLASASRFMTKVLPATYDTTFPPRFCRASTDSIPNAGAHLDQHVQTRHCIGKRHLTQTKHYAGLMRARIVRIRYDIDFLHRWDALEEEREKDQILVMPLVQNDPTRSSCTCGGDAHLKAPAHTFTMRLPRAIFRALRLWFTAPDRENSNNRALRVLCSADADRASQGIKNAMPPDSASKLS